MHISKSLHVTCDGKIFLVPMSSVLFVEELDGGKLFTITLLNGQEFIGAYAKVVKFEINEQGFMGS